MICLPCFLEILLFIALILGALKIYIKLNTRWNNCYNCLVGKTAIVTGSNTGIGYAVALDFAMRGARVILACRDQKRAHEARNTIMTATGNKNIIVKLIDMASFESVRAFAKDFNETETRLDILVNNAGVFGLGNVRTGDGFLTTMQVNHLSPFLLTHLLIAKLKNTPSSRVVIVSSYLAKATTVNVDQLDAYPPFNEIRAKIDLYGKSKLCNILFGIELAKKLEGHGVGVYSNHPGASTTEGTRNISTIQKHLMTNKYFFWTAEEGAQVVIYCSLSKDVEGHEGELFGNCKKLNMYEPAKDVTLAKEIWKKTEELVRLKDDEKL